MNTADQPGDAAKELAEGRRVRAGWADEMRPRRSTFYESVMGYRPVTVVEQGIYKVTHDDPCYILLEFDYFHSSRSSGDITCELTILVNPATGQGHYQKTRLNLLADRSVSGLASSLDKRMPELKIPWQRYLNDAVQWVLHEYRAGDPGVYLDDVPDEEQAATGPLPPLLAADGPTIIFGDGEATKSYLALGIAASLTSGLDIIPGMAPARPLKVGYLDWEWKPARHAKRLRALWGQIDGPVPRIFYMKCSKPITDERDRIRRAIRDEGLEFLIIDSAGYACAGAPEEAEIALAFFRTLESLGLGSLITAHITKSDTKAATEKPFGSVFWHNSARSTWYVKRSDQETVDGTVAIGLFERKNNEGQKSAPLGIRWHFDEGGTTIERTQAALAEEPSLASQLSTPKRIALLLRGGPMTVHEIGEELGAGVEAVRKALQRGEAFQKLAGGGGEPDRWGLAARE